jgi:hypothetical protein
MPTDSDRRLKIAQLNPTILSYIMKENMQPTPNSCFLCGDLEELQNNAICIGRVLESLACLAHQHPEGDQRKPELSC